jgi:hypothetical protein
MLASVPAGVDAKPRGIVDARASTRLSACGMVRPADASALVGSALVGAP